MDELHFQSSGTTDVKNIVEFGKLINVQFVFVGTYSKLDKLFMLNIEMVNIQTGKIEKSEKRYVENPQPKNKLDLAKYIAYSFIGFGVGYELFWDGNRVGFEPEWSLDQAVKNLQWNRSTYPEKKVEGYYQGKKMSKKYKCIAPFSCPRIELTWQWSLLPLLPLHKSSLFIERGHSIISETLPMQMISNHLHLIQM